MKRCIECFLFVSTTIVANGGAISGTVSPGKAGSVVYIEAIPGKTFPAPAKPLVMDQKSLLFQPHVLAVSAGCDGAIPEQRQGAAQHLLAVD